MPPFFGSIVAGLVVAGLVVLALGIQIAPIYYAWRHSDTFVGFVVKAVIVEFVLFGVFFVVGSAISKLKKR